MPDWVTNVTFLQGNKTYSGQKNQVENLIQALEHEGMGDSVVILNDDFYIMRPTVRIPNWFRGTLQDHMDMVRGLGWWSKSLQKTFHTLQRMGIVEPISYELHKPFHADRTLLLETLYECRRVDNFAPPQWRTMYGNMHNIGGTVTPEGDGKLRTGKDLTAHTFLSSSDRTFPYYYPYLLKQFPEPSRYEK